MTWATFGGAFKAHLRRLMSFAVVIVGLTIGATAHAAEFRGKVTSVADGDTLTILNR